ncbi:hypothetical protein KQH61_05950 [bacterium]|nr:hypothetical protein [bacterium]
MIKPYKYPTPNTRMPRLTLNRLQPPGDEEEELTGWVNGKPASDLEERYARGLRAMKLEFSFQVEFSTAVSLVGEDKVVDFVVQYGGMYFPVDINGAIGHSSSAQRGRDAVRETLLNEIFDQRGMAHLQTVWYDELGDQTAADLVVKRMFV